MIKKQRNREVRKTFQELKTILRDLKNNKKKYREINSLYKLERKDKIEK